MQTSQKPAARGEQELPPLQLAQGGLFAPPGNGRERGGGEREAQPDEQGRRYPFQLRAPHENGGDGGREQDEGEDEQDAEVLWQAGALGAEGSNHPSILTRSRVVGVRFGPVICETIIYHSSARF